MANFGNPDGSGIGEGDGERWGKGRGRGGNKPASNQPLRKPHSGGDRSEVVRNSVLSVDAAEFVPKSLPAPHTSYTSSVQERLNIARQSGNVQQVMIQRAEQQEEQQQHHWQQSGSSQHYQQQFPVPGYQNMHQYQSNQYNQYQQYNSATPDYGQYDGGSGDFASRNSSSRRQDFSYYVNQLEMGVRQLTMNPGKFDSLVAVLVDDLIPFLDKADQCEEIFNLLLQQSVDEPNFRYSGARLCTHLDTVSLAADQSTSAFRETIINKCQQKTKEQIETWKQMTKHTDEIEKKCHGLIFFLAELVNQMESTAASSLGKLLIQLMNTVLQNPAPNSTKNICQALKLAGGTLERENSELKAEMELVMRRLSDLVNQGKVDVHVSRLVSSVTELRSGNWLGQIVPSQVEEKQSSSQAINEPVYFGPDGQVLTEEERIFLEEDFANNEPISDPWENDENADEIAEAFEEFLQFSQNNNRQTNQKNVQNS